MGVVSRLRVGCVPQPTPIPLTRTRIFTLDRHDQGTWHQNHPAYFLMIVNSQGRCSSVHKTTITSTPVVKVIPSHYHHKYTCHEGRGALQPWGSVRGEIPLRPAADLLRLQLRGHDCMMHNMRSIYRVDGWHPVPSVSGAAQVTDLPYALGRRETCSKAKDRRLDGNATCTHQSSRLSGKYS